MASVIRMENWIDGTDTVVPVPINYAYQKWGSLASTTSTTYVDVAASQFSYTPKRSNSILKIVCEISIAPYASGGAPTGGTYGLFVNGVEQSRQPVGYEQYVSTANDLYLGRKVKTVYYTVTSLTALPIKIAMKAYTTATTIRINQGDQWDSIIHVWEIAQ